MPPRVPTIGKRPISTPTAMAVHTLEMSDATNIARARRLVLNFLERTALTMKKDRAPMTAMLKTFAPNMDRPPSPKARAWMMRVMVMLIRPAKGPRTMEIVVPPRKCHVLPPPATGNSNSWTTSRRALTVAIRGMTNRGAVFFMPHHAHARKDSATMYMAMHAYGLSIPSGMCMVSLR